MSSANKSLTVVAPRRTASRRWYSIDELASAARCSISDVMLLHRQRLLRPPRSQGYDDAALRRVRFVLESRRFLATPRVLRQVIAASEGRGPLTTAARQLLDAHLRHMGRVLEGLVVVEQRLDALEVMDRLQSVLRRQPQVSSRA